MACNFHIGQKLKTIEGKEVRVVQFNQYGDAFLGSDGVWRYDRENELERGRVTGTRSWPPDVRSINMHPLKHAKKVCEALSGLPRVRIHIFRSGSQSKDWNIDTQKSLKQVCLTLDDLFERAPEIFYD